MTSATRTRSARVAEPVAASRAARLRAARDGATLFAAPFPDRAGVTALARVPGIGPVRWRALLTAHGGDAAASARTHGVSPGEWRVALRAAEELAEAASEHGQRLLVAGDVDYPPSLLDLADPPPLLWVAGDVTAWAAPSRVAVVGTRANTAYGARITLELTAALAKAGVVIVSGLALGIDAIAHAAALDAGTPTIAVLGTAVDVVYPAKHAALHARVRAHGLLVSEHPPGTTATPGAFPRRNRIIAALAEATLVVEAGEKSGALITADFALEIGRSVAAVPGPVGVDASRGTNALLRDGAHVVTAARDVLDLFPAFRGCDVPLGGTARSRGDRAASEAPVDTTPSHLPPGELDADAQHVWAALATPAPDPDALAERTGLPARRFMTALAALEIAGLLETELSGTLRRR